MNMRKQTFIKFLFSHHLSEDLHKCYRIGDGFFICARCLGIYPVFIAAYVIQYFHQPGWGTVIDRLIVAAVPLPVMIDWAGRKFRLWKGRNYVQTITGFFLGLALSRAIHIFQGGADKGFVIILFMVYFSLYAFVVVASYVVRINRIEREYITGK